MPSLLVVLLNERQIQKGSGMLQIHSSTAGLLRKLNPSQCGEFSWKFHGGVYFLWDFSGVSSGLARERNEHFSLQAVGKLLLVLAE